MKRFAVIFAAGALLLGACSSGSSSSSAPDTSASAGAPTTLRPGECNVPDDAYTKTAVDPNEFKPATPGTLVVATSLPAPGYWNSDEIDPSSVKSGFEYDLVKQMQASFGVKKLVIQNVSIEDILQGSLGTADVAVSQIAASCRLVAGSNMSMPYLSTSQGVLVTKKFDKPVTTAEDVKALRWGVQKDTAAVDVLLRFSVQPQQYDSLDEAYAALKGGKIDAVLTDTGVALGEASTSHGALRVISQIGQISGPTLYTVVLPKSATTNTEAVNGVLQTLEHSGELSTMTKKNLTVDPATLPLIALPTS
jgi:polar amino acid transport system substrate-binding protein